MNRAASVQTVNTDQAAAWNGDEGRNWTEHADQYNRHTQRHRQRLLDADLFNPGDVALDIGCGTGKAARDVARVEQVGVEQPLLVSLRRAVVLTGVFGPVASLVAVPRGGLVGVDGLDGGCLVHR